jgi:hypothetical protein
LPVSIVGGCSKIEGAKIDLFQVFDMDVVETFALAYDAVDVGESLNLGFRALPCRAL